VWRLFVLSFFFAQSAAAPDWDALFRGLVKVEALKQPTDTGAGTVISVSADSIRIVTAAHVVENATKFNVYFYSDPTVAYKANLLPRNSDRLDLAVLEVLRSDQNGRSLPKIPQLVIEEKGALHLGQHVWTVDSGWRPVPNTVTTLDHDSDTQKFEYTRGATGDGFSGGAVFNDDGRLIGIHDAAEEGGMYAIAVKLDSAVEVLTALGHNTPNLVTIPITKIVVRASRFVTNTTIRASAGQKFTIIANGRVDLAAEDGSYIVDANGTITTAPADGSGAQKWFKENARPIGALPVVGAQKIMTKPNKKYLENAPYGALVAGFSQTLDPTRDLPDVPDFPSGFVLVGSSGTVVAPAGGGYLFLAVNDYIVSDNSGSFDVEIAPAK
jgi:S1-C subfamily serine protease